MEPFEFWPGPLLRRWRRLHNDDRFRAVWLLPPCPEKNSGFRALGSSRLRLVLLASMSVRELLRQFEAEHKPESLVQAEVWGLIARFGLFCFPHKQRTW